MKYTIEKNGTIIAEVDEDKLAIFIARAYQPSSICKNGIPVMRFLDTNLYIWREMTFEGDNVKNVAHLDVTNKEASATENGEVELYVYPEPATAENRLPEGKEEQPYFKNTCNSCTFLGTFEQKDLYHCFANPQVSAIRVVYGPDLFDSYTQYNPNADPKAINEARIRAAKPHLTCT